MAKVIRSAAADRDILSIGDYGMGVWGIEAAIVFGRRFNQAFALLADHPEIGRARDEIGAGIRSWLHRGYVIYYRHRGDCVVIGRVLHGAAEPSEETLLRGFGA